MKNKKTLNFFVTRRRGKSDPRHTWQGDIGGPQAPSIISSADIRLDLHWLPINHRISYKISLLTWKALYTAEPSYLSELISPYVPARTLRSSNTYLLAIPTGVTSHFSSRSFSVSPPSTWNSLPQHIRSIDRLSTFKRQLKSHFFQSAFTV